jgi:hypothetical protein
MAKKDMKGDNGAKIERSRMQTDDDFALLPPPFALIQTL